MIKKVLFASSLLLLLAACATPTTYHPYNGVDGYSDIELNTNLYRINFRGNEVTSKADVKNMLLYRAADITLTRGYRYFQVVSQRTMHTDDIFYSPGEADSYGVKHRHHHHTYYTEQTYYTPPSTTVFKSYNAQMTVKLLRDNNSNPRTYNALTITDSLSSQISFPPPPKR